MPNEYSDCLCDKLVKKGKFIKYEMLLANCKTTCIMLVIMKMPWKKVPISSLGQVDFLAGQVRFNGKGLGKSSNAKLTSYDKQEIVPDKQKCESCLPNVQARFQDFF